MQTNLRFTCDLTSGMHARPASILSDAVRGFASLVTLAKAGAAPVDLRSVLSIVGLDVKQGDDCVISAEGPDAEDVMEALRPLVSGGLARADETSTPVPAVTGSRLPPGLRALNIPFASGQGVSGGVGLGLAVVVRGLTLCPEACSARPGPVRQEIDHARRAVEAVTADLRARSAYSTAKFERELLSAHGQIAGDPALWAEIERRIRAGATAAQALVGAADTFAARLRSAASAYIRDRVIDVQDVAMQVLEHLGGVAADAVHIALQSESVVFAEALTANQLLRMDRARLRGLVMGRIGATSHTVILARSLRVPTVIGAPQPAALADPGQESLVDADGGIVFAAAPPEVKRYYERRARAAERRARRLAPLVAARVSTADGQALEVGANASSEPETVVAMQHGADGVGLLRTETLFLDRDGPPTEEEQFDAYSAVVRAARGRPVIIRTFDIGGDKSVPYLGLPAEDNPFLGCRGLRLYQRHGELLRTQLRAILRSSALGPVKVMAPMVSLPAEAAWFKAQVLAAQQDLADHGAPIDRSMPVGIMIEIPGVAWAMDRFCTEVDFFSLGTNDLCQYWFAADRGNPGVMPLSNPLQPSFLRLLRDIVRQARAGGRWIGVCGEMGGRRSNIPIMLGLGVDEISAAPGEAIHLKALIQQADASRCRALLERACDCRDAAEVQRLLGGNAWRADSAREGVLSEELIAIDGDAKSKHEAIADAVDLLAVAGRTDRPRDVEEAVWAREETYSTGLGHGFAVPHCKTDAVASPSLALLRLAQPVEWGSLDGQPVSTVILLAIPASDTTGTHMKVFAKLARRLMHESFRDRLASSPDSGSIRRCLLDELELG